MTTKLSPSKIKPIIIRLLGSLPSPYTTDNLVPVVLADLGITEDAWGHQSYGGGGKGLAWTRYNINRANSQLARDGDHITKGSKKGEYLVVGSEPKVIETPIVEEPKEETTPVVEETTPVVEEITPIVEVAEEELEDMDALLDDIFDDVRPVYEKGEGVAFELPTPPPENTEKKLDAHMVNLLGDLTGCFGYYSERATKCKECPLAHHCAKELNKVMDSIGKALAS